MFLASSTPEPPRPHHHQCIEAGAYNKYTSAGITFVLIVYEISTRYGTTQ